MNNKTLAIIFTALLALYLLTRLFSARPESTFRSELVQVDTSMVDKIELYPKSEDGRIVTLLRNGGQWTVTDGNLTAQAVVDAVNSLLGQLNLLRAKRVVAKSADNWKDYEVDEAGAIRVKAFNGNAVLTDFMVGRFNFNQQTRQATSYLRLSEEDAVYAVDGLLTMTFGQDMNAFRNKQMLKLDGGTEVNGLQLQNGDQTISFRKSGSEWLINDATPADSTAMAAYLGGLRFVAGNTFVDDFQADGTPGETLRITAGTTPITISAFAGGIQDFVIASSQYPGAFFASDSSGIYQRLFGKLVELAGEY